MAARKPEPFKEMPSSFMPSIEEQLKKRRGKWRLNVLEWEDFCQMFRMHICRKFYQFDPLKGEFSHWINGILSRYWINCQRDAGVKHFRPCIANGGCAFALPNGGCRFTKSGIQDTSCKLYKVWYDKKFAAYNIIQTLSLETHGSEIKEHRSHEINIEQAKAIIDAKLKPLLSRLEWKIYSSIYMDNKEEEDTLKSLGFAKTKKSMIAGHQKIVKIKKKAIELTKKIIDEEGLA